MKTFATFLLLVVVPHDSVARKLFKKQGGDSNENSILSEMETFATSLLLVVAPHDSLASKHSKKQGGDRNENYNKVVLPPIADSQCLLSAYDLITPQAKRKINDPNDLSCFDMEALSQIEGFDMEVFNQASVESNALMSILEETQNQVNKILYVDSDVGVTDVGVTDVGISGCGFGCSLCSIGCDVTLGTPTSLCFVGCAAVCVIPSDDLCGSCKFVCEAPITACKAVCAD